MAPDSIAEFFNVKVRGLVDDSVINENVYNGKLKLQTESRFFMDRDSIIDCVKSLKIKNSEGYDRIPQRILFDGLDQLIDIPLQLCFPKYIIAMKYQLSGKSLK